MKRKKLTIALVASTVAALMLVATLSVYAYFTTRVYVYTEDGKEVAHVGMNLQLLFGKLSGVEAGTDLKIPSYNVVNGSGAIVYSDNTTTSNDTTNKGVWANVAGEGQYLHYNDGVNDKTTYDPDAPWGSAQNPYVISEARHLQNLSALQSVGYFDLLYVANNFDANGDYIKGSASIPYFLICTDTTSATTGAVAGTPVTISGTDLAAIKPIGSAEHPFIGVIGGAFADGTTTVSDKSSSVSAIHGFQIQTNTNQTDVGLFGYVGFLGEEPTAAELAESMKDSTYVPAFEGVFSSIQNMLVSDVSVTVASPTLGESISELFEPFWQTFFAGANQPKDKDGNIILHRFTFSDMTVGDESTFHETHHIGIFAGHVSYALIDQINVYYSNDDTHAIDVTGTSEDDNYYSASGILGMMYNMNCTVENQATTANNTTTFSGNCRVLLGTGTSGDEVGSGGEGTGTGGGALSGNGRGYVTAAEIFSDFNNVDVTQSNNELLWRYKLSKDSSWVNSAVMIYKKSDGTYTLADGKTVATIGTGGVTGGGKTWANYLVREVTTSSGTGEEKFSYKDPDGTVVYVCELMGNKYNGQTIWNFSAGGDGIWHSGIRVLKNGDVYTLDDKEKTVVTFDATNYAVSDGNNVWEYFFITETNADGTVESYMYDSNTGKQWTVNIFERKPMTLIEAYRIDPETNAREDLCIEWVSTFLWTTTNTGLYYFYDGVFTFGLSSAEDTIRDTWMNNKTPTLYLGENDPTKWEHNSATGNAAVMAFLTPVTDNKTLNEALSVGKQLYISAKPNMQNTEQLLLMSLLDGERNAVKGTTVYLDQKTGQTVYDAYLTGNYSKIPQQLVNGVYEDMTYFDENGVERPVTVDYLLSQWNTASGKWNGYEVLNIGKTSATTSLEYLQKMYNVSGTDTGNDVYYDDNGLPVTVPPNPTDSTTIQKNTIWSGYIYCTYYDEGFIISNYKYQFYYVTPEGDQIKFADSSVRNFNLNTLLQNNGVTSTATAAYGATLYSGTITDMDTGATVTVGSRYYDPSLNNNQGGWTDTTTVPVITITEDGMQFIGDNVTASLNGSQASKPSTVYVPFYYYDTETGHYYSSGGQDKGPSIESTDNLPTDGMMLTKYPTYIFSNATGASHLQLISETKYRTVSIFGLYEFKIAIDTEYMLFAGTQDQYEGLTDEDGNAMSGQENEGVLVFNDDGSCFIKYTLGTQSHYVNYIYTSAESTSNGFSSSTGSAPMYVYVIEGVVDMEWGVNTFIPTESSTSEELSAGSVVFWPQTTLKQDGTYTNNGQTLVTGSTENATMTKTTDPVYTIKKLSDMKWGTADGYMLGSNDGFGLDKKFQMADQAKFGTILNLDQWDLGTLPSGESSIMVAPVGSNGVEATIPKGCVAFRVESGGTQTIRIIVAVPTTDKYVGSEGLEGGFELDWEADYYIGVWQVEAAGESLSASFQKSNAVEKFELPRSYTFNFEDTPSTIEDKNYYTIVEYGGTRYRTYLNGDCFLVAYEFTIGGEDQEGGVYVLGSVHGEDGSTSTKDVPMEIVHFSVSGTASAGRDGVTGNQLGAIDFVYDDTEGNIATIDKNGSQTGPTNGTEYYSNYYASQCLLYSNNEQKDSSGNYLLLNKEKVWIRRYVDNSTPDSAKTIMAYQVAGDVPDSFLVKQYAINSDEVEKNE